MPSFYLLQCENFKSSENSSAFHALPGVALVRLDQFLGTVAPVSRATWFRMIKAGQAPPPIKLSKRVSAWRVSDLREWLAKGGR